MRPLHPGRAAMTSVPGVTADAWSAELERALRAWREQCDAGAVAIATQDPEGLERALAAREALRPRIEAITGEIQRRGGASLGALAAVRTLGDDATTADAHLVALLESERLRLRQEIDSLRRGTDSAAAYRRPDAPNPHRLDIVR